MSHKSRGSPAQVQYEWNFLLKRCRVKEALWCRGAIKPLRGERRGSRGERRGSNCLAAAASCRAAAASCRAAAGEVDGELVK